MAHWISMTFCQDPRPGIYTITILKKRDLFLFFSCWLWLFTTVKNWHYQSTSAIIPQSRLTGVLRLPLWVRNPTASLSIADALTLYHLQQWLQWLGQPTGTRLSDLGPAFPRWSIGRLTRTARRALWNLYETSYSLTLIDHPESVGQGLGLRLGSIVTERPSI